MGLVNIREIEGLSPIFRGKMGNSLARALEDNFITVTPKGDGENTPTQESILGMKRSLSHLQDGHPLGIFPAGAVSDLSLKDRCVRDRPWQEPVIRLIQKAGVPVVPIRFFDGNSLFYSLLGLIDWRVRLLRLPHEVLNKAGRIIRVGIGAPISAEQQSRFSDAECFSRFLRNAVYGMPLPEKFTDSREIHQKFLYEVDSKNCLK